MPYVQIHNERGIASFQLPESMRRHLITPTHRSDDLNLIYELLDDNKVEITGHAHAMPLERNRTYGNRIKVWSKVVILPFEVSQHMGIRRKHEPIIRWRPDPIGAVLIELRTKDKLSSYYESDLD